MSAADGNAAASGSPEAARSAALDLHEGIVDPAAGGCARWPEHLRLRSSLGELVRGRCRATNLCAYCARLAAVETSELLMLDAMEDAPALYAVLTARELLERADCRRHLEQLRRALRRRWPSIRWAVLVEFQRRGALHLNLLVKGVPSDDVGELHERISALWCSRVEALPRGQFVGRVNDGGGLVRYIALHFLKPAQAPPIGWRGHRVSYSRGYLVRPAAELREEARRSLRLKRELRAARRAGWTDPADVELVAREAIAIADATSWELVQLPAAALAPGNRGRDPERRSSGAERRPASGAAAPSPPSGLGPKGPALGDVDEARREPLRAALVDGALDPSVLRVTIAPMLVGDPAERRQDNANERPTGRATTGRASPSPAARASV